MSENKHYIYRLRRIDNPCLKSIMVSYLAMHCIKTNYLGRTHYLCKLYNTFVLMQAIMLKHFPFDRYLLYILFPSASD